jgi:hypothetical protein
MYVKSENGFWVSGYRFFHLLEIYKYENCLWALILSPAGIYLATCGQEDKMVFYLEHASWNLYEISIISIF